VPTLNSDFEAPALKAKLEILVLLADSLRPQRRTLDAASDWHKYIVGLAQEFEKQVGEADRREHVINIWQSFTSSILISRAPNSVKSAFKKAHEVISTRIGRGLDPLEYLATANERAHTWMLDLLSKRGLKDLLSSQPVAMSVFWDQAGRCPIASSSRLEGEIVWAFQPYAHSLWGALVADHVIAHEYLSHLVPRNLSPWRKVREGWLMELLLSEIRNSSSEERRFDLFALEHLQRRPVEAFDSYALYSVRAVADVFLSHTPDLFWRLTGEILRLDDGEERAQQVEDLIQKLADLRLDELKTEILSRADWSLEGLSSYLDNRR